MGRGKSPYFGFNFNKKKVYEMLVLAKKSLFLARKRRLFVLNSLLGFLSVRFRKPIKAAEQTFLLLLKKNLITHAAFP